MPTEDVRALIGRSLLHDEETAMAGVRYRAKDLTEGLDGILYTCAQCGSVGTTTAGGNRIRCTACGLDAELDGYYRLHGAPVGSINEWFYRQQNGIDLSVPLTSEVRIGTVGDDGLMCENAGHGVATLNREEFTLSGEVFGEVLSFRLTPEQIGAFPITVGKHFDVYYHNRLYYVYPLPDMRATVLWVSYMDRLAEEAREKAASAQP